jgi:hypothetical protein
MRNIIIKKKCLLFKHEKNNQTLSNDWPAYCHMGIYEKLEKNKSHDFVIGQPTLTRGSQEPV